MTEAIHNWLHAVNATLRPALISLNIKSLMSQFAHTGHDASAAAFSESAVLRPLKLSNEISDAYMAIGRCIERMMNTRIGSVLDTQMASAATEEQWHELTTAGSLMVQSDMRRLIVLRESINHLLALQEEVLRSVTPRNTNNGGNGWGAGTGWTGNQ